MSEREPFLIRGHHLGNFALFDWSERTPEEQAERVVYAIQNTNREPEYILDTIGGSPKTIATYTRRLSGVFEEYATLGPDHPITITVGAPDGICSSCTLGHHCREVDSVILDTNMDQPYLLKTSRGDREAVNKFLGIATALALCGALKYGRSVLPDVGYAAGLLVEDQAPTFSAEYVKKVLRYWWTEKF